MASKWHKKLAILAILFALCLQGLGDRADQSVSDDTPEGQLGNGIANRFASQSELGDGQSETSSDYSQSETSSDYSQSEAASDPGQLETSQSEAASDPGQLETSQSEEASDPGQLETSQSEAASDFGQLETSQSEAASDTGQLETSSVPSQPVFTTANPVANASQANTNSTLKPTLASAPIRPKRRFNCSRANRTVQDSAATATTNATSPGVVVIINSTEFTELRLAVAPSSPADSTGSDNQTECAVLLYYLPYCPYSMAIAPHYNALARAFPGLHFFAVDADRVSPFYANYTTNIAPYIRLFRDRDFLGVNTSLRTLDALTAELANLTGHSPEPNVTVTEADHIGPVSATLVETTDYWLIVSCLYFALLTPYLAAKGPRTRLAFARLRQRLELAVSLALGPWRRPHAD